MNRSRLLLCLAALLAVALVACSHDTDNDESASAAAVKEPADDAPGVKADAELQQRLGLELAPVEAASLQTVATGTAIVLDGQAFAATLDDLSAARSDYASLRGNSDRLQRLFDDGGNASRQALEAARSQTAAARAKQSAAEAAARATWGARLIDARDADARLLQEKLAGGRALLLRGEFSAPLATDPATLQYALAEGRQGNAPVAKAAFIEVSRSPALSTNGAAVTLAALTDDATLRGLRPGARLAFTAATPTGPSRAMVPASAVIADGGQLWCYVARTGDRFERVAIAEDQRVGERYPAEGLVAGDRVIVRGAPLLLSLERSAGSAPAEED